MLLVYLWSAGLFIAALVAQPDTGDDRVVLAMDLALALGIALLGAGWLLYDRKEGHLLTIFGWQAFGIYWILEVPNYINLHPGDPTNVILYAPALALFTVFSVYEYRAFKGGPSRRSLKFIAGLTFIGAGVYFLFAKVSWFGTGLIWATAAQTSWVYNLFGGQTSLGLPSYDAINNEILVPILGTGISIILACTAIEAIVIFLGAFIAVEPRPEPWKGYKKVSPTIKRYMRMSGRERRARALVYTIVPIWVLNIVRNVAIIWLVQDNIVSFDVAHGYAGKGFSFLVLLALAIIVFDLVPEIYDDLLDIYRLGRPERGKEGEKKEGEKKALEAGPDELPYPPPDQFPLANASPPGKDAPKGDKKAETGAGEKKEVESGTRKTQVDAKSEKEDKKGEKKASGPTG